MPPLCPPSRSSSRRFLRRRWSPRRARRDRSPQRHRAGRLLPHGPCQPSDRIPTSQGGRRECHWMHRYPLRRSPGWPHLTAPGDRSSESPCRRRCRAETRPSSLSRLRCRETCPLQTRRTKRVSLRFGVATKSHDRPTLSPSERRSRRSISCPASWLPPPRRRVCSASRPPASRESRRIRRHLRNWRRRDRSRRVRQRSCCRLRMRHSAARIRKPAIAWPQRPVNRPAHTRWNCPARALEIRVESNASRHSSPAGLIRCGQRPSGSTPPARNYPRPRTPITVSNTADADRVAARMPLAITLASPAPGPRQREVIDSHLPSLDVGTTHAELTSSDPLPADIRFPAVARPGYFTVLRVSPSFSAFRCARRSGPTRQRR